MALQLLKRNYTLHGFDYPKILRLPQGEARWAPRRLPVDIGDVMMNMRMDDSKHKYIGEHISKYAQGLNPYGEFGQPYKVNKNNIRPPIIDPKYYQALSRMPVKFESISSGPIVKDLYGKQAEQAKLNPKLIIDRVCAQVQPTHTVKGPSNDESYRSGNINLHVKQPRTSIPYHPSIPVHRNTGVPDIELDAKIFARPNMGIHFPYHVSDQSRDINNMRTPMHVAVKPGYKDPYFSAELGAERDSVFLEPGIQIAANPNIMAPVPTVSNITRELPDLTPKVQTSAWYNPSYFLTDLHGYSIGDRSMITDKVQTTAIPNPGLNLVALTEKQMDVPVKTRTPLNCSQKSSVNGYTREAPPGRVSVPDSLRLESFEGKASLPSTTPHQQFTRVRENTSHDFYYVSDEAKFQPQQHENSRVTGIRQPMKLQESRVDRSGVEPDSRVIPVGTGRFVRAF